MGIQFNGNTDTISTNDGTLNVTPQTTFGGEVGIAGTLTYEDVTNVDAVGIITARSGIKVTGGDVLTSGNTQLFGSDTSDGSDNKAIMINGGGATSDSRGGYLLVHGNEHSSFPGITRLHAGNVGTAGIEMYTAGSQRLSITSDGKTGIGTDNPQTILHILDNVPTIRFTDKNSTGTPDCEVGGAGGNVDISADINGEKSDSVIRFNVDGSEKVRIDSTGNVGVGTNVGSDSTGSAQAFTIGRAGVNGQLRFILKNQQTGFGNGAGFHQCIDGANVFIENRSDGGYLDFSTNDSSSITSKLRIISTGNFAIGNTHGAKKIHISHTGNQKILIDPNYNNNSGGSSNSEANANNVVDSILVRTSFGDNAASQTNAGHKWGIKFQGYNGNDFTQNISKVAAVYAVSEDEAGGYNRNVGLTFHTSPYNTNHREAMRINTTGAVTKPYHPAFAARLGSGNITISSSNTSDMVFNTEEFDNSNSYNTSNDRFTAPVAGKYYFGVQLYAGFDGAGVRVMHANFRVNGTSVAQTDMFGGASNHGGTHYHPTAVGHMFRNLNANDYVTFNLGGFSHTGGQAILYASTGNRFFGYLVG